MSAAGFVPDPSWPSIVELATKLWGEPTDKSDPNDIRFGAHGSKSVKPSANTWHDFEAGEGGGYVDIHLKAIGPLPNGDDETGPEPWFNVAIAYDYRDGDGVLIAQNVRMKPGYRQRFMQRQPSGKLLKDGQPVWRWSTKGLKIPLYRTPEMYRADPQALHWLTEGEKDADRLAAAGLIATTNIAGAASWNSRHNGDFAGRHVVILEDNDDAGRKRSARIAPGLIGIAKSVKVLALPGLPEKGDVSDWLDAGGTIEELERLAREAPEFVPSAPEPDAPEGREEHFSGPEPEPDGKAERLADDARQAELERLADLKEDDPIEYDDQREDAADRIGCRLGTLDDVIDKIIADRIAAQRLNNPPSASGPAVDTPEVTALIAEFNVKYFVLNEVGKTVIYAPKHDHQLHRDFFERITFDDFQRLYLNRFVKTGVSKDTGEPTYAQAAQVWLRHRDRHQYIGGMVFDPSDRKQPDDVRNLWHGFGVDAKPGSCQLFKEHLQTVICCGDTALYEYVMDWCADAVQHPDRRGQVALVLCGPEGTGKGIFANAMKRLFGQHGLAISNAKHLVGHFNAHLRDTVLLFADEAFYAGDKAHTSILKAIITEGEMVVEAKYQNAVPAKNYLHIIMASNEPWVVPASLDSRRFAVIAVALSRMGDLAYFADIQRELEHGGYEALLAELLDRVPFADIRQIPVTDALITQRKLSLDTTEAWWLDCLHKGYVFTSKLGLEDKFQVWLDPITTELLYQSYELYCRTHGERHPLSRELLGGWLRTKTGCRPVRLKRAMVGEHITDATTTGSNFTSRVAEPVWKDRPTGYRIGTLDPARAAFLKATGLTVEWPDGPDEGSKDDVL